MLSKHSLCSLLVKLTGVMFPYKLGTLLRMTRQRCGRRCFLLFFFTSNSQVKNWGSNKKYYIQNSTRGTRVCWVLHTFISVEDKDYKNCSVLSEIRKTKIWSWGLKLTLTVCSVYQCIMTAPAWWSQTVSLRICAARHDTKPQNFTSVIFSHLLTLEEPHY